MKREYRVIAFRKPDIVFLQTFGAESQDESIMKMIVFLKEEGNLSEEEVEKLRFISCPSDFNSIKKLSDGEIEIIE